MALARRRGNHLDDVDLLLALVVVLPEGPPGVHKAQPAMQRDNGPVNRPLVLRHTLQRAVERPPGGVQGVVVGGWARDNEHTVRFVAVLGVVAREVDVPAAVERVQLRGPDVA